MLFHRIEVRRRPAARVELTAERKTAGGPLPAPELSIRTGALALWLGTIALLAALAVVAALLSSGTLASGLLTLATAVATSSGLGVFLGERSGEKAGAALRASSP